jgi:hypothetical protein
VTANPYVRLSGGTDNLTLASGINSLSVFNVEHLAGSDYAGAAVNDALTLLNDVSGMTVDLAQGDNVLNLAAATRSSICTMSSTSTALHPTTS